MIITRDGQHGSIGGGNLEFTATDTARMLLTQSSGPAQQTTTYGLGPSLNQCCGGAVELLYEYYQGVEHDWLGRLIESRATGISAILVSATDRDQVCKWVIRPGEEMPVDLPAELHKPIQSLAVKTGQNSTGLFAVASINDEHFLIEPVADQRVVLYLFGAGHVSSALVKVLEQQAIRVTWSDERESQFPSPVPENVEMISTTDPLAIVQDAEPGAHYLVMTHSHELDEDLCHAILNRGDFSWLGLIGSMSKRKRFEHRLAKRGIEREQLDSLTCPVGMAGITGKRPATIAVSIAAQLLMEIVPESWR
jgi:xanthine dehydrogenase accessory factor